MPKTIKYLELIEDKLENLDLVFLKKIHSRLLYKNPYFLVCFSEVVHKLSNDMKDNMSNLSMDELLIYLNKRAERLYLSSNISEELLMYTE